MVQSIGWRCRVYGYIFSPLHFINPLKPSDVPNKMCRTSGYWVIFTKTYCVDLCPTINRYIAMNAVILEATILFCTVSVLMNHPHAYLHIWRRSPQWARASSFARFLDHTQWRTTVGRTPFDEWSAWRRYIYLTTHNTHNTQTPCPRWDSNPQYQQTSDRRPTPQTARPLGSALADFTPSWFCSARPKLCVQNTGACFECLQSLS